jgi:penicillin-binding protein 1A
VTTQHKNHIFLKSLAWLTGLGAAGIVAALSIFLVGFSVMYSRLPAIDSLTDYRPKVPLRIYSAEGLLIGEFGEERRDFVHISEIPSFVKNAILAAEDNGFYQHGGIEFSGIARAAIANFISGRRGQGGSTITMQVARNFFLSSQRTYTRKLYEIAMAAKIENTLTKDQILEVYLNQIYLGQRAYGFASAAQIYFGKKLEDLTVGEAATIAGLPVAPSAYNPIVNPKRAMMRRGYVLGRMKELGYITPEVYEKEMAAPLVTATAKKKSTETRSNLVGSTVHAEYAAELARMLVFDIFGDETYTRGLNVYTTIRARDQRAAWSAVRRNLIQYDRKYGYRGPIGHVDISNPAKRAENIRQAISRTPATPGMVPAVVTLVEKARIRVAMVGEEHDLDAESIKFAKPSLSPKAKEAMRLVPGSIVRVSKTEKGGWTLAQIPEVESGFISAEFNSGAVRALVGGFDFYLNMYNHVTQALRQPGSSFKPFIYSAALDKGFHPSTIINDAPIFIDPRLTGGQLWEPRNYDGKFDGPMTLATALRKSKNLVSIRIMQAIGTHYTQEYAEKFGFPPSRTPAQLTTALGAGSTTPWEMVGAYSVFANGGYRVKPYLIDRVTDTSGNVLMRVNNPQAGNEDIRAIDERNAFVMHTLLHGVVHSGTGARAYRTLGRSDMGGKTGTSNNAYDAWFAGYAGRLVAVDWVGFDHLKPLGARETGGGLALPIWIDYMKVVLKDDPLYVRQQPGSVVELNGTYYFADNVDESVHNVPLDGKIEERNRERDILRDQIF